MYLVTLFIGVAIGALLPISRGGSPTPLAGSAPATADCASVAIEPAAEILGAPTFRQKGTIASSVDGLILVRWSDVRGAKSYNVQVWDETGKQIKSFEASKTFTYLKGLPVDPTQKQTPYYVVVTPIGGTPSMRGKVSEKKMVAMLPLRNLAPPTIKSIQTEAEEQPK